MWEDEPKKRVGLFHGCRGACLIGLLAISAVGLVLQVLAYFHSRSLGHGDGWNELGIGLAIMFFGPFQIAAGILFYSAYLDTQQR
jgi:hypothetical protein